MPLLEYDHGNFTFFINCKKYCHKKFLHFIFLITNICNAIICKDALHFQINEVNKYHNISNH